VRNLFFTATLVALAGAPAACGRRPLPQTDGNGGIGGGPSRGTGGSAGAGGTTVVDECLNHDIDLPSATLMGTLTIDGVATGPISSARILLRNGLNDLVEIPFTDGTYVAHVAPGSYDVFFSSVAPAPTPDAPANRLAFLQQVTVARGETTRLDIGVPVTSVAGTITISGAPLAADDEVSLSLRNAAGDIVPIASNSHGSFTARVVPGTFDLFFTADLVSDGSRTPTNQLARIARNVVLTAGGAARLDVDVPSAPLTGAVVITGLPAGDEDAATLVLRNAAGDMVRIALTNGASYASHVVPGSYDLYVSGASGPASLANQNARLRTGVVIAPGGTVLNVDVPSVPVEGAIRIDGVPPDSEDSVYVVLRNALGDQALIVWDADGGFSVRVVPGTYDLFYAQGRAATSPVPANQLARLQAGVVVDAAGTTRLDINVVSTTVTGSLKINGAPSDAGNSGILQLRSAAGDRVTIGNTSGPSFSARVVPGTYDLFYIRTATPNNTSTAAPANQAAKLRSGIVVSTGAPVALDIDIPSATVTGAITINGGPAAEADVGTIFLQSDAGDIAAFPLTGAGSYMARVVPGTYDIYFSRADSVGSTTPMNTLVKLRCFTVP
jgi:hypothetical protein